MKLCFFFECCACGNRWEIIFHQPPKLDRFKELAVMPCTNCGSTIKTRIIGEE